MRLVKIFESVVRIIRKYLNNGWNIGFNIQKENWSTDYYQPAQQSFATWVTKAKKAVVTTSNTGGFKILHNDFTFGWIYLIIRHYRLIFILIRKQFRPNIRLLLRIAWKQSRYQTKWNDQLRNQSFKVELNRYWSALLAQEDIG